MVLIVLKLRKLDVAQSICSLFKKYGHLINMEYIYIYFSYLLCLHQLWKSSNVMIDSRANSSLPEIALENVGPTVSQTRRNH